MTSPKTETKPEPERRECACGCGEHVQRPVAQFRRGHDSQLGKRLRQQYANGELSRAQVIKTAKGISVKFHDHVRHGLDQIDARKKAERAKARNGKPAKEQPVKEQEPAKELSATRRQAR